MSHKNEFLVHSAQRLCHAKSASFMGGVAQKGNIKERRRNRNEGRGDDRKKGRKIERKEGKREGKRKEGRKEGGNIGRKVEI